MGLEQGARLNIRGNFTEIRDAVFECLHEADAIGTAEGAIAVDKTQACKRHVIYDVDGFCGNELIDAYADAEKGEG